MPTPNPSVSSGMYCLEYLGYGVCRQSPSVCWDQVTISAPTRHAGSTAQTTWRQRRARHTSAPTTATIGKVRNMAVSGRVAAIRAPQLAIRNTSRAVGCSRQRRYRYNMSAHSAAVVVSERYVVRQVQLRDSRYPADGEGGSDPGADVMACDQEEHNNRDCRQSHRHQPRNRRRLPGRQQRGMQRGILGGHARFDEDVHLLEEHGDSRRGPAPGSFGEQFRLKQHRAFVVDRARLTPGAPDRRHQRSRHQTEDERRRRMPHDQRGRTNRAKVLHRHPTNREQDRQRHQGASQGEQKGRLVHRRGAPCLRHDPCRHRHEECLERRLGGSRRSSGGTRLPRTHHADLLSVRASHQGSVASGKFRSSPRRGSRGASGRGVGERVVRSNGRASLRKDPSCSSTGSPDTKRIVRLCSRAGSSESSNRSIARGFQL